MSTQRFPVDYDAIAKGDVIPVERVERILGHERTHPEFRPGLLRLKADVRRELWARGKRYTVCTLRGGLAILTDSVASPRNHAAVRNGLRAAVRAHVQNLAVDAGELTDDQRKRHERYVEVDGRTIQAVADVRPRLVPEPVRRGVPGLPGPE